MRFSIIALVIGAAATASSAAVVDEVVESRGNYNWPKCSARCWPPNSFKYQCSPFDYGCLCSKHDKWGYDLKNCFKKYCNDYDYKQSGKGVGYYCKNYGLYGTSIGRAGVGTCEALRQDKLPPDYVPPPTPLDLKRPWYLYRVLHNKPPRRSPTKLLFGLAVEIRIFIVGETTERPAGTYRLDSNPFCSSAPRYPTLDVLAGPPFRDITRLSQLHLIPNHHGAAKSPAIGVSGGAPGKDSIPPRRHTALLAATPIMAPSQQSNHRPISARSWPPSGSPRLQDLHQLLSSALRPNPCLAAHIRRVVLSGVWAEGGELLELCGPGLRMLDIALDVTQLCPATQGIVRDLDAEDFCEGLKTIKGLTHLVVRKPNNVYLTQPKPRYVLAELAMAVNVWDRLEYADLAFRLSDDSNTANMLVHAAQPLPPSHLQAGPMTALVQSLSTRPKLHTFCTLLPSVWNETILRVSKNPSLERIILGDGMGPGRDPVAHTRGTGSSGRDFYAAQVSGSIHSSTPSPTAPLFESNPTYSGPGAGILGTGLFFMQAKKHTRLSELIRAGTYVFPPSFSSPLARNAPSLSTRESFILVNS
ncbi:hypothetical protein NLJ89_g2332 [Agrocybe chaxingu]|uniref:CFEM domain-containing protein n=1 Tax=Agrocybe chaxingu TaxID=84603 RepID=A0A9W8K700_9AGAR|nr:hypothetical protein NLJ89_g2332 [Agrocybe chaxingu]